MKNGKKNSQRKKRKKKNDFAGLRKKSRLLQILLSKKTLTIPTPASSGQRIKNQITSMHNTESLSLMPILKTWS